MLTTFVWAGGSGEVWDDNFTQDWTLNGTPAKFQPGGVAEIPSTFSGTIDIDSQSHGSVYASQIIVDSGATCAFTSYGSTSSELQIPSGGTTIDVESASPAIFDLPVAGRAPPATRSPPVPVCWNSHPARRPISPALPSGSQAYGDARRARYSEPLADGGGLSVTNGTFLSGGGTIGLATDAP